MPLSVENLQLQLWYTGGSSMVMMDAAPPPPKGELRPDWDHDAAEAVGIRRSLRNARWTHDSENRWVGGQRISAVKFIEVSRGSARAGIRTEGPGVEEVE